MARSSRQLNGKWVGGATAAFLKEYWAALRNTPVRSMVPAPRRCSCVDCLAVSARAQEIFKRIAFRRRTLEEELQEVGRQGGAAA